MNLAGQPTSRPAHRLLSIPHDACTVLMYADDRRVDHLHGGVMGASQCIHNPGPHARSTPANEAIVARGVRTECIRQVAPLCPRKTQKMPLRTRRSLARGTPLGLFGSIGLMAVHS